MATRSLSSDYRGEWGVLNIWATWRPPCIAKMPYLQTLADRGLNVLGVNMGEEEGKSKLFTVRLWPEVRGSPLPDVMPDVKDFSL